VPPKTRDPALIDQAPISPDPQDFDVGQSKYYVELVGQLAAENEQLRAEVDRLTGSQTYEEVRVQMMKPYANKVYWFLVWYCVFVAIVILLCGFRLGGFQISDTVLGIIAGSTAVSAIGLVGFVVSGLFGSGKSSAAKRA
jgi:hypothetical protein